MHTEYTLDAIRNDPAMMSDPVIVTCLHMQKAVRQEGREFSDEHLLAMMVVALFDAKRNLENQLKNNLWNQSRVVKLQPPLQTYLKLKQETIAKLEAWESGRAMLFPASPDPMEQFVRVPTNRSPENPESCYYYSDSKNQKFWMKKYGYWFDFADVEKGPPSVALLNRLRSEGKLPIPHHGYFDATGQCYWNGDHRRWVPRLEWESEEMRKADPDIYNGVGEPLSAVVSVSIAEHNARDKALSRCQRGAHTVKDGVCTACHRYFGTAVDPVAEENKAMAVFNSSCRRYFYEPSDPVAEDVDQPVTVKAVLPKELQ